MHTGMSTRLGISSGLTFDDGDQLLVSAQKPLGILLEEREPGYKSNNYNDYYNSLTGVGIATLTGTDDDDLQWGCILLQVIQGGTADRAGVREGDVLVAVQNADVANAF
jgi:S1-C subfamily serine protease